MLLCFSSVISFSSREVVVLFLYFPVQAFLYLSCFSQQSYALHLCIFPLLLCHNYQRTIRIRKLFWRVQIHPWKTMQNTACFSSHFYRISFLWQCPASQCCSAGFVCSFSASGPTGFLCILSCGSKYKENLKLLFPSKKSNKEKNMYFLLIYLLDPKKRKQRKWKIIKYVHKFLMYISKLWKDHCQALPL